MSLFFLGLWTVWRGELPAPSSHHTTLTSYIPSRSGPCAQHAAKSKSDRGSRFGDRRSPPAAEFKNGRTQRVTKGTGVCEAACAGVVILTTNQYPSKESRIHLSKAACYVPLYLSNTFTLSWYLESNIKPYPVRTLKAQSRVDCLLSPFLLLCSEARFARP